MLPMAEPRMSGLRRAFTCEQSQVKVGADRPWAKGALCGDHRYCSGAAGEVIRIITKIRREDAVSA